MATIRVYNTVSFNPRKKKPWTYKQAVARKDQAERFTRDVVEDDDRADEIAAMSVEEYATARGKEIRNPNPTGGSMQKKVSTQQRDSSNGVALNSLTRTIEKQQQRIQELERENKSLQGKMDEIVDVVECDEPECTAEEHLAEIEELVANADTEDE